MLLDKCHEDVIKDNKFGRGAFNFNLSARPWLWHTGTLLRAVFTRFTHRSVWRGKKTTREKKKNTSLGWSRTLSWRAANINMRAAAGGVGAR